MSAPPADDALLREEDPRLADIGRRVLTISVVLTLFATALVTLPVLLLAAAAVDLAYLGRRTSLRCAAFLFWYLLCETGGLLLIALLCFARLRGHDAFLEANRSLQKAWGQALFLGARLTFGIRFEAENQEAVAHGPVLLLVRHATVIDTLIPTLAAEVPFGLRLRYVLKSELLWDPCLDIVGNRMGHYFARRGSGDTDREVARVAELGRGLGEEDGVLIYPEGTRFTEAKRARILERLEEQGEAERLLEVRRLRHVLPPKVEGVLGLLDAAPQADVVVCAHTGLERTTTFWELWTGSALRAVLKAHFWRIPRTEVPAEREARIRWLNAQWRRVDDWIDENRPTPEAARA